jgi:hypothetical protein
MIERGEKCGRGRGQMYAAGSRTGQMRLAMVRKGGEGKQRGRSRREEV